MLGYYSVPVELLEELIWLKNQNQNQNAVQVGAKKTILARLKKRGIFNAFVKLVYSLV
jgi:hypothetical protein